ncbi:MAG TPA: DUF4080 domain-containing protein [Spirochaetota bacterium]|nr:DUF4080 domain-containing protein [Spirochaetota bacterium]HOD13205.1 DUF4080 domain-containing protein [Spirochaetota bacterium]HPG48988.1 DUF4080 domain-containing protein [Spirochaetota bacterium]HPN10497.1 DUF4080 domain-containing protein [Spirochaetota bacterium]HQL80972.1 DUF4080 domain-containing protein [Spirochaetota bacterium]
MKTVLLAAINARYTHSCLALYCLKSYAAGTGSSISVREYSINRDPGEILADMAAVRPDIIGLSVYIWNSGLIRRILPLVKERCGNNLLLLGGPEVSYNPESWIEDFPCIDCIIAGPGEAGFRSFLENGTADGEKILRFPNPIFGGMPFPYSDEDLTALADRYVYYESSRGCPYRCAYCLSSRSDQRFQAKSMETVKNELGLILRHRPKLVKFVDRTFNMPGDRHREIWSYLIDRFAEGPTVFHFEIHPSNLDEEDFAILARTPSGLFQFEAGVQSVNPEVRTASGRSGEWKKEKTALARLISLGTIRMHLDLIAGLPFEGMASASRSFNEVYALSPGHFQLGILKVLPGTEMRDRADEYGMIFAADAPYQVRETRWLPGNELQIIEKIAAVVDRLYNTGRFPLALARLAARFDSPFDLYRAFASERILPTRSWESGASFLLGFTTDRFPEDRGYVLDALGWDWCAHSRSHRYPDILKPEQASGIKKKGYAFFRGFGEDGTVRYGKEEFALSDLKRAIFYKSETEEFRKTHMGGSSCALFLHDGRIVMYDLTPPPA